MKRKKIIRAEDAMRAIANRVSRGMEKERVLTDAERAKVLETVRAQLLADGVQESSAVIIKKRDLDNIIRNAVSIVIQYTLTAGFGMDLDALRADLRRVAYSEIERQVNLTATKKSVPRGSVRVPAKFDHAKLWQRFLDVIQPHTAPGGPEPEAAYQAAESIGEEIRKLAKSAPKQILKKPTPKS